MQQAMPWVKLSPSSPAGKPVSIRGPVEQFPVRRRQPKKNIQFSSLNVSSHMSSLFLSVCVHMCEWAHSAARCVCAGPGLMWIVGGGFPTKPEVCNTMAGFYVGSGRSKLGSSDLHSKRFTH